MAYCSHGKPFTKDFAQGKLLLRQLYKLLTYQISFTKPKRNKQKLASCVISIILNSLARCAQKMCLTKMKPFSVTSVNFGFLLNVPFKLYVNYIYLQNCDASCYCLDCCRIIFLSTPYQVTKTSKSVVLVQILTSCCEKIQE